MKPRARSRWLRTAVFPALAIRFTIRRTIPSGSPGDRDMFGSQHYGPLLDVEIPLGNPAAA